MLWPWKNKSVISNESGVGLVEALIAMFIVGIALTALVATLSTGSIALRKTDETVTADNLAQSQLEYTKGLAYLTAPVSYGIIFPLPDGYSISADASSINGRDTDIQKITVSVSYDGNVVHVLESYKMNR